MNRLRTTTTCPALIVAVCLIAMPGVLRAAEGPAEQGAQKPETLTAEELARQLEHLESLRWPRERAWEWYRGQPWLVGCNFIPSTASNQLEMWQGDTFDPRTIDRELSWGAGLGMNTVRVYLHNVAWQVDREGFKKRMDEYLSIADKHGIRTLFVVFDDCWNDNPKPGPQPPPVPGVHNSRWLKSPGSRAVKDRSQWPPQEEYLKDLLRSFGRDERVLAWDLYNEPGAGRMGNNSLPLLLAIYQWAREAGPSQPLTTGIWNPGQKELNQVHLRAADIISFHHYGPLSVLKPKLDMVRSQRRPALCTEYMSRGRGCTLQVYLPFFKQEQIACYNWGLVAGKTQTYYPWGSPKGAPEPELWHHDLLRPDGTPFDQEEVELFRRLTGRGK